MSERPARTVRRAGGRVRRHVHRHRDRPSDAPGRVAQAGSPVANRARRVVELNCGTGEDAAWLRDAASRSSPPTPRPGWSTAARASRHRGRAGERANRSATSPRVGPFDGALSNFGGLNCVADLRRGDRRLCVAACARGVAVLCIMGPVVPWEWVWFLAHGRPRKAVPPVRSRHMVARSDRSATRRSARVRRLVQPSFDVGRVWALGCVDPASVRRAVGDAPSPNAGMAGSYRTTDGRWPGVANIADHYVIELDPPMIELACPACRATARPTHVYRVR